MNENDFDTNNENKGINLSKEPDQSSSPYASDMNGEVYPGGMPADNSFRQNSGTSGYTQQSGDVYADFGRSDDIKKSGSFPPYPPLNSADMTGSYRQSDDPNISQGYTTGSYDPNQQPFQGYSQPYGTPPQSQGYSQPYGTPQSQGYSQQYSNAYQQPAAFSQGFQQPYAQQYNGQDPYAGYSTQPDTKLATASMVLGIISIVGWLFGFIFPLFFAVPIIGLILGIVHKSKHIPAGKGTSTAGIIMSVIGILIPIIVLILVIAMMPQMLEFLKANDPEAYQEIYDQYADQLPNWFSALFAAIMR